MIKFAIQQWDKNKDKLKKHYTEYINNRTGFDYDFIEYKEVVKNLVKYVYNDEEELKFNADGITQIDNGDYQGTLLYMIPEETYQPDESEYLLTYVGYGSCSGCDTLQRIESIYEDKEKQISELMNLSLHLVQNTIKPYNNGWRKSELFDEVGGEQR